MGSTLIEKIIEKNTGLSKVTPGQIVTVNVDRVMIHDIFICLLYTSSLYLRLS